jgi:ABC-type multidrug transport system fused ATPase/permease subunit
MPPKQRQIRIESKSALAAMQQLENRSDEELEAETRFRAAAQAILGARAAERMDAKRTREHFRAAIAAARPQERLQLRRMAEASLALAERRADDLKVAAERLGQTPPTNRQLLMLRLMGVIAPPASAGMPRRIGGVLIVIAIVILLLALGWGIVQLVALPFGGIDATVSVFWGFLLVAVVIGVMAFIGRRRQRAARAKAAEARAGAGAAPQRRR